MTSKSVVTVTIPSYNYVEYLRESAESAASQTGVDVDVVIVENASTDGSRELARCLADEYANIRVVEHSENLGIICSLDRCRDEVRGEYTVLLCADDCLTPGSLLRSVEFMDAHQRVGLSYGPVVNFGRREDVTPAELEIPERAPIIYDGIDWIGKCARVGEVHIHTPEALMRSSTLARAGRLDPACPKTSDLNMWLRMATHGDVAYLPGPPLAMFRRHDRNDAAQYSDVQGLEQQWIGFSRFFAVIPDRPERSEWEAAARRALAREARSLVARNWMQSDRIGFDAAEADQLLEFARSLDPTETRISCFGTKLSHRLGAKGTRTLLIPKRALNRYQRVAAWKRIRRSGV